MEAVRRVLITLWGVWGVLVFLITLILVTPVYLGILSFGGKRSQKWAHQLSRAWARILFGAFLVQVNVHHANQLAADEPYIFIANHTSLLDVPAKALATSHFFKFLAKQELTRVPLLGRIVKQLYVTVPIPGLAFKAWPACRLPSKPGLQWLFFRKRAVTGPLTASCGFMTEPLR